MTAPRAPFYLLFLIFCQCLLVKAVYHDEAYTSDWQLTNIGPYKCVVEGRNDTLLVVSDLDNVSMLSWLNKSDAEVLIRQPLDFQVVDVMILDKHNIAVKTEQNRVLVIDSDNGFTLDQEISHFSSSCSVAMIGAKIQDNSLLVYDYNPGNQTPLQVEIPDKFTAVKYFENDNSGHISVLFASEGDVYHYREYTDGELSSSWTRDESLTDVVAYTYISATDEETKQLYNAWETEESLHLLDAYFFRVKENFRRFKHFVVNAKKSPGSIIADMLQEDDDEDILVRNLKFGLSKKLILVTGSGKIVSLDILTGLKDWTFESGLHDVIKVESGKDGKELYIFTQNGLQLVLGLENEGSPSVVSKTLIPLQDKVTTIGDFEVVATNSKKMVFLRGNTEKSIIMDHSESEIQAYLVDGHNLNEIWNYHVAPGERIVEFRMREDSATVNVGTVLGNRTVLYKYLNPNLASFLVTDEEERTLTLTIIDAATGEIVHRVQHDEGVISDMPINLVFGEHWAIYSFFSTEPVAEQKLAVLELYESSSPNKRVSSPEIIQDAFDNTHKPFVHFQSFVFSDVIKKMILTKTKFGITSKAIVLELENGQLTYLPKFLLNARRVEESKMTASDKREFMAAPYVPGIPINDNLVLSHARTLIGRKQSKLLTIPTNLESTSLVCSLSHDIFCTTISPSSQFDKIPPSFEKGKLLATIAGLLALCYFLKPIVETKKLKAKWLVKDFSS